MGEEKPSVPWVLEDYETSQIAKPAITDYRDYRWQTLNLKRVIFNKNNIATDAEFVTNGTRVKCFCEKYPFCEICRIQTSVFTKKLD